MPAARHWSKEEAIEITHKRYSLLALLMPVRIECRFSLRETQWAKVRLRVYSLRAQHRSIANNYERSQAHSFQLFFLLEVAKSSGEGSVVAILRAKCRQTTLVLMAAVAADGVRQQVT